MPTRRRGQRDRPLRGPPPSEVPPSGAHRGRYFRYRQAPWRPVPPSTPRSPR
jgi:hypothetical protein